MIPVSLRLKNFMSYGADAPVLDFEQFQVACLSGRNGQGKSALLDAITWVLWGEARKSSGSHKPDDELLRIGEREMQVEFVFDIEGERYRVVRAYHRSASGKTSRPELELHMLEAANGDYRPLTGTSIRETQTHIDNVVGLDYDTFVNSAFLLQGRSDEFTKKRPSDRKEILSRILNLSRYEFLHELAAAHERDARKVVEQADLEVVRLTEALAPEAEWKAQHAQVEEEIRQERVGLETLRAEEKALDERLVKLDARAREAESLRHSLDALHARIAQHQEDAAVLRERITRAEALIGQREAIQHDHERYQALQKERDELDAKNELFRGIEKQLERVERDLKDRKNELERQLDKHQIELKAHRRSLAECEALLVEAPSVRRKFEEAQAARKQEEAMRQVLERQQALDLAIQQAERAIDGEREALTGRLKALEQQLQRERRTLPDVAQLESRQADLRAAIEKRDTLTEKLEATREQGQAIADDLHVRSAKCSSRKEELSEKQEQVAFLHAGDSSTCPTCGTELTPAHRDEVEGQLRDAITALERALAQEEHVIKQRTQERDKLRVTYTSINNDLKTLDGVSEKCAAVEAQLQSAREVVKGFAEREAEALAVRRQLETEAFGRDQRAQRTKLKQERKALAFDEEAYERVRREATQVERFEDKLRYLAEAAGRKEQLTRSIEKGERETETLRRTLDEGTAFGDLQEQMRRLSDQLAHVGFDQQRFRAVKQAMEELSEAGTRMTALVNAQQNHVEWKKRLAEVMERAAQEQQEHDRQTTHLAKIEAELEARASVEAQRVEKADACREADVRLQAMQVNLGQLSEKLEKAARDRKEINRRRKEQAEARSKQGLYKHLRAAFGKHGIPSLIIEQTLPHIEERTNELLDRLSDGRMHVRLETLKDRKTGSGTIETLEIKITDEQGVSRPYETFSGGEGFRINFALRIALAQLLAERSGVRVRTLVIDEGFGTQDQHGVQNLVDAIQAIQDDFDKILVITHLSELKEAFPVRIEVEKDPVEGSQFEIIGV